MRRATGRFRMLMTRARLHQLCAAAARRGGSGGACLYGLGSPGRLVCGVVSIRMARWCGCACVRVQVYMRAYLYDRVLGNLFIW